MMRAATLLAGTVMLVSSASQACGPSFPIGLLERRSTVLTAPIEGSWHYEIARILPPPATGDVRNWGWTDADRAQAEAVGLDAAARTTVLRMRAALSVAEAESHATGLSTELALYTSGAVAWHLGDLPAARERFGAVAALPAQDRQLRGVWASYMLGRVLANELQFLPAAEAFRQARAWARGGLADPFGLALASLGEEGRAQLDAGDAVAALRLYHEYAANDGDDSGELSLLDVARQVARDPAVLEAVIADETGRKVMVAYLFSRGRELDDGSGWSNEPAGAWGAQPASAAIRAVLRGLAAYPDETGGRLAALAYAGGEFAAAEQLVLAARSPLAQWVRAKLAIRAGNYAAAAEDLATAARHFPREETYYDPGAPDNGALDPTCRVTGEAGVLALSRGEYVQAMELLYAAVEGDGSYWDDVAYVGERVLTVDELRHFVDRRAAVVASPPGDPAGREKDSSSNSRGLEGEREFAAWTEGDPEQKLRWLLARRLMRKQRFDDALPYFDDPPARRAATNYATARRAAQRRLSSVGRAEAWYQAARIAKADGMEILGFEHDPDYFSTAGSYDLRRHIRIRSGDAAPGEPGETSANGYRVLSLSAALSSGSFVSDNERGRVMASRGPYQQRFHYRDVAVDHALSATELLPSNAQAYAAVLCHAAHWIAAREPEKARELYARYLERGAFVPWGDRFGTHHGCPAPEFMGNGPAQWAGYAGAFAALAAGLAVAARRLRRGGSDLG
jgi:tetratricopeptide (TPR) repeat protein